jgi:hypothetical protein
VVSARYGRADTLITTPQGTEAADSDLKPLPWADESGSFGGSTGLSGAAIFQHVSNPRCPAGWCLRQYGFIGVSWPGVEIVHLVPGQTLTLRFRVWVHEGDAQAGKVQEAFDLFAKPPSLSLSEQRMESHARKNADECGSMSARGMAFPMLVFLRSPFLCQNYAGRRSEREEILWQLGSDCAIKWCFIARLWIRLFSVLDLCLPFSAIFIRTTRP